MAWPKGRPRGAQQGNAADVQNEAAEQPQSAEPAPDTLEEFREWAQRLKFADGVVLVELTHPESADGTWDGMFSGFATKRGPRAARWSDGSTFAD